MKTKILLVTSLLLAAYAAPASAQIETTFAGFAPASGNSWVAGAVAGYNWQRGSLVFGFEGDISGMNLKSETTGTISRGQFLFSDDAVAKIDWYGTVRGRLGWTAGSFLFYGTGGLAYGNVKVTNAENLGPFGVNNSIGPLVGQYSAVRAGWVAGAGIDYMVNKNLIVGLQYQYIDLGTDNLAAIPSGFGFSGPSSSVHAQFQVVTVSASWKFPPPESSISNATASMHYKVKALPPAPVDPWAGYYVGGRAGGAWGDRLNVTPAPRSLPTED